MSFVIHPLPLKSIKEKIEKGSVLFDLRSAEMFSNSFIPGSVFIGPQAQGWAIASSLFDKKTHLILVGEELIEMSAFPFLDSTNNNIEGYLIGGFAQYSSAQNPIDLIIDIEADEFGMDIPFDANMLIIDVRQPEEFENEQVKNALNIPLTDMGDLALIAGFEDDQNIYIYGEDDIQGLMAASLLKRQGYHNLRYVKGGWQQIKEASSIPLKKIIKEVGNESK